MNRLFEVNNTEMQNLIDVWYSKLMLFSEDSISIPRNSQLRNIRQVLGHMIDSVSNNTHRVIHLQYQQSPVEFPNYAAFGNNDRWIAIQNYEDENWGNMVQLWKYAHLHFIHVVNQVDRSKLNQLWISGENEYVTLQEMIEDFPRHFKLHLSEIEGLLQED